MQLATFLCLLLACTIVACFPPPAIKLRTATSSSSSSDPKPAVGAGADAGPDTTTGRLPLGTQFTGYSRINQKVVGEYYQYITIYDQLVETPFEIIVVPEQGYFINSSLAVSGLQWTILNGTYYYLDIPGVINTCWYSFTGTYANETQAVKNAVKISQDGVYDRYLGYVNAYGACGLGGAQQFLINTGDGSLKEVSYAIFTPQPAGSPTIPTTVSGYYDVTGIFIGGQTLPPLPEKCWGMDYANPNNNFCYFWHYGAPCNGFGSNECQPNPGPYQPQ